MSQNCTLSPKRAIRGCTIAATFVYCWVTVKESTGRTQTRT